MVEIKIDYQIKKKKSNKELLEELRKRKRMPYEKMPIDEAKAIYEDYNTFIRKIKREIAQIIESKSDKKKFKRYEKDLSDFANTILYIPKIVFKVKYPEITEIRNILYQILSDLNDIKKGRGRDF